MEEEQKPNPEQGGDLGESVIKEVKKDYRVASASHLHRIYIWIALALVLGVGIGIGYVANRSGELSESAAQQSFDLQENGPLVNIMADPETLAQLEESSDYVDLDGYVNCDIESDETDAEAPLAPSTGGDVLTGSSGDDLETVPTSAILVDPRTGYAIQEGLTCATTALANSNWAAHKAKIQEAVQRQGFSADAVDAGVIFLLIAAKMKEAGHDVFDGIYGDTEHDALLKAKQAVMDEFFSITEAKTSLHFIAHNVDWPAAIQHMIDNLISGDPVNLWVEINGNGHMVSVTKITRDENGVYTLMIRDPSRNAAQKVLFDPGPPVSFMAPTANGYTKVIGAVY